MPAVAAELLAVAPGVMLEVSDGSHEHLTKALRAGDLEAVIGRLVLLVQEHNALRGAVLAHGPASRWCVRFLAMVSAGADTQ